jgi:hypothetical protein
MTSKIPFRYLKIPVFVTTFFSVVLFSPVFLSAQGLFPLIKAATDSLTGFDEAQALKDYNLEPKRPVTYPVYLSGMKRLFISRKYNIDNPLIQRNLPDPTTLNTAFCNNSDFANGTFSGWTGCSGCNPTTGNVGYCVYNTPCGLPGFVTNLQTIMTGTGTDPATGAFPVVCPGYTYSARLGTTVQTGHFYTRQYSGGIGLYIYGTCRRQCSFYLQLRSCSGGFACFGGCSFF